MTTGAAHVTTDPTCSKHEPPRTWWQRWRFDRARGRACPACVRDRDKHEFDVYDGASGRVCTRMVIEDGDGVECGLPAGHPIHALGHEHEWVFDGYFWHRCRGCGAIS